MPWDEHLIRCLGNFHLIQPMCYFTHSISVAHFARYSGQEEVDFGARKKRIGPGIETTPKLSQHKETSSIRNDES